MEATTNTTDPLYDPSDRDVAEFHCKHGTFTGNPYGGDYLCGWCESGEEPLTQRERAEDDLVRVERAYDELVKGLEATAQKHPRLRWAMIRCAETIILADHKAQRSYDLVQS